MKVLRGGTANRPALLLTKKGPRRVLAISIDYVPRKSSPRARAATGCTDNQGTILADQGPPATYVLQGWSSDIVVFWTNAAQLNALTVVNGGNFASGGNYVLFWSDLGQAMRDWMLLRNGACSWYQGGDSSGANDDNAGHVGLLHYGDCWYDCRASVLPYCAIGNGAGNGRNEITAGNYHAGCPIDENDVVAATGTVVQSGRPVETDISVNYRQEFCTNTNGWCSNPAPDRFQLRYILRHELGHSLGHDHTCVDRTGDWNVPGDPHCSDNAMDADPCFSWDSACSGVGLGDRRVQLGLYP